MTSPRVSIVIPVYNGANYLRAAIDSALAQDYANVEVLVINDGSTDGGATETIAHSYGERIRYMAKPNGGVASALNAGIAAMTGEMFCWLSHDDRHLPNKTGLQVREWERLGRPDDVLIADYREIDANGRVLGELRYDHAMLEAKPLYALLRGSIHGCTVFLPRRLFDAFGTFDEALPTTQDYDLWHRMIRGGVRFRHMPEVLIESRTHAEQGSRTMAHRGEARALWHRMVTSIPTEEQTRLEGSPYRFLAASARYLAACGLDEAAADLQAEAQAVLDATLVSLVIQAEPRADRMASLLAAAAAQSHPSTELIVVEAADGEAMPPLPPGARLVSPAGMDGLTAARGEWVALVAAGTLPLPERVARQLQATEAAGAKLCHTAQWHWSGGALTRSPAGASPTLDTVLIRRDALQPDFAAACAELVARGEAVGLDEGLVVRRDMP